MIKKRIKYLFTTILANFLLASSFALVDVWNNITLNTPVSDDLHLSATVQWFETCDFIDYMWEETSNTLFIETPYEKDMAMIYSNDLNDNPWTYTIKLTVTCNWWDPADNWFIEEDSFILTINWWSSSNQAPTDISISKSNIDENVSTWTTVWILSTIDSDSSSFTYDLTDYSNYPDNQNFKIQWNQLIIDISPDYETKNLYIIKIQTTDDSWNTFSKEFIITINDIDETTASVDAWPDQNINIWDTVYLKWSLNWFPANWCTFKYTWNDDSWEVTINNANTLDQASFETNTLTWPINLKISLEVIVTSTEMTYDSCWKTWNYWDLVTIFISNNSSWTTTNHSSYYWKMRKQAQRIDLSKVKLNLYEQNSRNKYFYKLWWNYIGWDRHIKYEIQYSTWKNFITYNSNSTFLRYKLYSIYELWENDLFFFRVRATYNWKYSPWSNIISIVNKNNLLSKFKISCINCSSNIDFTDVLNDYTSLIDNNLDLNCKICNNLLFQDIFDDEYSLISNNFKIRCKKCSNKKKICTKYKNKTRCSIERKIDYNDLLK